ncbi:MAG: hypothetical protein OEZ43_11400 [Gammaproteobacteria bacterium]|nr:hypothetical protein [Gammaproteobacteria bacterium]
MSAKDNAIYLEHMLDCNQSIEQYVERKQQFYASQLVQDVVIRNLQVMAESSQRLAAFDHFRGVTKMLVPAYGLFHESGRSFKTNMADLACITFNQFFHSECFIKSDYS